MGEIKERGQASIFIELVDGVITVKHGTDKDTLAQWIADEGDWDKIWDCINKLKEGDEASPDDDVVGNMNKDTGYRFKEE